MAAGALAFSVMSAAVKLAGSQLPLFQIVFIRSAVVAVLAAGALWRAGTTFRPQEPRKLLQRSVFGFATLCCYFYSIIELPLADATVIYFINPVLTALGAALVLGEHMRWREVGLAFVSLAGVVLVARPGFLFGVENALNPLAVGVGLAGSAFSACSWLTIRTIRRDPPLLIVFYFSAFTVVLATPLMLRSMSSFTLLSLAAVVVAGVATHLAQLWITWGLRLEKAGRATAVGYVQIVFAALWGWILFADVPDVWTWAGALVITVSTVRLMHLQRGT